MGEKADTAVGSSDAQQVDGPGSKRYDAFVSYSHADRPVAEGVQEGLQRIARPMGHLNALRVFRDDTDLIATPDLFGRLTDAMDSSRFLVVVLSPHAAASEWVNKEVTHWLERDSPERMLMVLAEGTLDWDERNRCLDPTRSTAALPVLMQPGALPLEPLWIDVSGDAPWEVRSAAFRDKVTDLSAPIHGKSKYELASDDVHEQKRFRRWRRAAVGALALLTVLATLAAIVAVGQRQEADRQRAEAIRQSAEATRQRNTAVKAQSQAQAAEQVAISQRNHATALALAAASQNVAAGNSALAVALAAEGATSESPPPIQAIQALVRARTALVDRSAQPVRAPLVGHSGSVTAVAFSDDGRWLASAGGDGTVRLWDPITHVQKLVLDGSLENGATSVAFSSNSRFLAAGGGDGTLRVWAPDDGRLIRQIREPGRSPINGIAFGPGGRTIAAASDDGWVRFWNPESGAPAAQPLLAGPDSWASAVAFGRTGDLATIGGDPSVRVWNTRRRSPAVSAFKQDATALAISPNGLLLAFDNGNDGTVEVWNLATRRHELTLSRPEGTNLLSLAFSPDSKLLAAGSFDKSVTLWNVSTGTMVGGPLVGHSARVNSVAFSSDGKLLASASSDGSIVIWDLVPGEGAGSTVPIGFGPVVASALSPDGSTLAAAATDGRVHFVDLGTGNEIGQGIRMDGEKVVAVAFSPTGSRVAVGGDLGAVALFDRLSGGQRWSTQIAAGSAPVHDGAVTGIAFSGDGEIVASSGDDGHVVVCNAKGDGACRRLDVVDAESPDGVASIAVSSDGRFASAGTMGGSLLVWDLSTGHLSGHTADAHQGGVYAVAFSPDGRSVASAGADDTIRLWTGPTLVPAGKVLAGNSEPVHAVAFTKDGGLLLGAGEDGHLRIWQSSSGALVQDFPGSGVAIAALSLSREDDALVTQDWDGAIHTWGAPWDVEQSCALAVPFVTPDQLDPFVPSTPHRSGCWPSQ